MTVFHRAYRLVRDWAAPRGIGFFDIRLPSGIVGEFNGPVITLDLSLSDEERVFYAAHSIGSIVLWSIDLDRSTAIVSGLRATKHEKGDDAQLKTAIDAFREFEEHSSSYAVWLFRELRLSYAVKPYANFMRADLEALAQFHRFGTLPRWSDFFRQWNAGIASGSRQIKPFIAKPIPAFQPRRIEKQTIYREP